MTFAETHGRFGGWIDQVQALYPVTSDAAVDPAWFLGVEHLSRHDSWNRIVAWFDEAATRPPRGGAVSRTETIVAVRVLRAHVSIWAPSAVRLEHMIHALIVAIDDASGDGDFTVANLKEVWFPKAGVTHGGWSGDLSFDLAINVLASDPNVITAAASPGDGTPLTPATALILGAAMDDADIGAFPDLTLPVPEE